MATSTTILGELSCAICLEPFEEPVTLPCMHSFCKQCVADIQTSRRNPKRFNCPECRRDIDLGDEGIDGLPKNFTIAKLVDKCKEKETQVQVKPCSVCEVDPPRNAAKTCLQCNVSYCEECVKVMHPSRGAFAQHKMMDEVTDTDEGPSNAKKARTDETDVAGISSDMFCPSCNKIITSSKYIAHQRLGHKLIDMKAAREQKLANTKRGLQQLERFQQDLTKSITNSESALEVITDEGKRQMDGITRCLERIKEMLVDKERQLSVLVKREITTTTAQKDEEIQNKRRFYSDLLEAHKQGTDLAQSADDDPENADLLEAALKFEQRLSEFEAFIGEKVIDQPINFSGDAQIQMKKLENQIQGFLENKPDNFVENTSTSSMKKLEIESAVPLWKYGEGCINVNWNRDLEHQGQAVDLKVCHQNKIITVTNIAESAQRVDKLQQGVAYVLTICVQGHPETESDPLTVRTLEDVVGKGILFDSQSASMDVDISVNGKVLMHRDNSNIDVDKYNNVIATSSTRSVSDVYWETKLNFNMRRLARDGETAFEVGICDSAKVDKNSLFRFNTYAYICNATNFTRDAFLVFESEGRPEPRDTRILLPRNDEISLYLGFFLNSARSTFSVLNVTEERIIHTFTQIRRCDSYLAVFGVGEGEHRSNIRIELIAGKDIKRIPRVLFERLM